MEKVFLDYPGVDILLKGLHREIDKVISSHWRKEILRVFGVPRGGIPPSIMLTKIYPDWVIASDPEFCDLVFDDIIDSGKTRGQFVSKYKKPFLALIDKTDAGSPFYGKWVVFPWEVGAEDGGPEDNVRRILQYIGEDPDREGLRETPKRVLKALVEMTSGTKSEITDLFKTFDGERYDEIILCRGIEFDSLCEHHLLPFSGVAHIAYIPSGKVVGLSKMARLLEVCSRRLQIQERLTQQITKAMDDHLAPKGSACIIEAKHSCMSCRGVRKQNSDMVTSSLTGVFLSKPEARSELLTLIGMGK